MTNQEKSWAGPPEAEPDVPLLPGEEPAEGPGYELDLQDDDQDPDEPADLDEPDDTARGVK